MFADQMLADDIIQQVHVYLTLKRPALIHVHCSDSRLSSIVEKVVATWNASKMAPIKDIDSFDRYRIKVRFMGMPYKSKCATHNTFTVGKADVIIVETH